MFRARKRFREVENKNCQKTMRGSTGELTRSSLGVTRFLSSLRFESKFKCFNLQSTIIQRKIAVSC